MKRKKLPHHKEVAPVKNAKAAAPPSHSAFKHIIPQLTKQITAVPL
jgi:hypothetical protein